MPEQDVDQALAESLRGYLKEIEEERAEVERKRESTLRYLDEITGGDTDAPDDNGVRREPRARQPAEKRMEAIEQFIRENGGKVEQIQIRKELDLDTGTTTRLVHRLQEEGRVKIKRVGRANTISIARETKVKPGEGVERGREAAVA